MLVLPVMDAKGNVLAVLSIMGNRMHRCAQSVPAQMWALWSPVPAPMWDGASPVPEQMWQG